MSPAGRPDRAEEAAPAAASPVTAPAGDGNVNLHEAELGKRLRELRRAHGHSLAKVADATNISTSFLSLVEAGRSDITLRRLLRLIDFYGITLGDLLPDGDGEEHLVVRRDARRHVVSPAEGIDCFYLFFEPGRVMMPMLFHIQAGGSTAERARHDGEEFVYVLQGQLRIEVEGLEPLTLTEGDSAYFPGSRPHAYSNDGADELRFIAVVTPPSLHVY